MAQLNLNKKSIVYNQNVSRETFFWFSMFLVKESVVHNKKVCINLFIESILWRLIK